MLWEFVRKFKFSAQCTCNQTSLKIVCSLYAYQQYPWSAGSARLEAVSRSHTTITSTPGCLVRLRRTLCTSAWTTPWRGPHRTSWPPPGSSTSALTSELLPTSTQSPRSSPPTGTPVSPSKPSFCNMSPLFAATNYGLEDDLSTWKKNMSMHPLWLVFTIMKFLIWTEFLNFRNFWIFYINNELFLNISLNIYFFFQQYPLFANPRKFNFLSLLCFLFLIYFIYLFQVLTS